ncbi:MAG: large conductance mechanosensitive channel protein MscL [Oscillospiraceae bacterium]|jgi:large conductance mechanosensitive channel|nr:large conductance mechanosensitive channel protein MscL [Oscillospiraceae bacterium]
MKKFLNEFKEFALRGNVIDMAVGIIIGAAFKSIVDSLVKDLITPLLGLLGGMDFSEFKLNVPSLINGSTVSIHYGSFITAIINFLIMAVVIFCMIKGINSLKKIKIRKKQDETIEKAKEAPTTKECPYCKSKIAIAATRCPHCTSQLN